jgi:hypothetical protein
MKLATGLLLSCPLPCFIAVALLAVGCASQGESQQNSGDSLPVIAVEQVVRPIPLGGDITQRWAEVSGLAWYRDDLIILPQYPERFAAEDSSAPGCLFTVPKAAILAHLDGTTDAPIEPRAIPFDAPQLDDRIPYFDGFEAVAFHGERAYFTIEARSMKENRAYLVAGVMAPDLTRLKLETDGLASIPVQTNLRNMSHEALLIVDEGVLAIQEANGANVNPAPAAQLFGFDLELQRAVSFPTIEYRVTDATDLDTRRKFWVLNYFYPPEKDLLNPAEDQWCAEHGVGPTHARCPTVERLVEFRYTVDGVKRTGTPPIPLQLVDQKICRNWEGLVRLNELGFLLMTDRHPETILGFVARP